MMKTSAVRTVASLAAVGVLGLALVACDSGGDSGDGTKTLTFVTYSGGDAAAKYEVLIDGFEKANPGVTVELEEVAGDASYDQLIRSRIQSGTAPDVFEILNGIGGMRPYVDAGLLTDLSTEPWVEHLLPAVADQGAAFGGKQYAFTTQLSTEGLFYNKEIFAANGVEPPRDWEAYLDAVKTLNAAGVTPAAVGGADGWTLWLQTIVQAVNLEAFQKPNSPVAASLVDGSAAFSDSDEWREILDSFQTLVEAGTYGPNASGVDFTASANEFANGQAAMLVQGDFALNAVRTANPDLEIGYLPFPSTEAGVEPAVALSAGGTLAVPAAAPNADLAKKLLAYLAEPATMAEYLTAAAALPSLDNVQPEDLDLDPALAEILPAVRSKSFDGAFIGLDPQTTTALQAGLQGLLTSTMSVDDVLASMDQAQP